MDERDVGTLQPERLEPVDLLATQLDGYWRTVSASWFWIERCSRAALSRALEVFSRFSRTAS